MAVTAKIIDEDGEDADYDSIVEFVLTFGAYRSGGHAACPPTYIE
jgi:hypothetical protein